MSATVTSVEAYLHRKYLARPDAMSQSIQDRDPIIASLAMKKNIGEDNRVPITIAPARGLGATISDANTVAKESTSDKFVVNGIKAYITLKFGASDLEKASNSENALINLLDQEMESGQARMAQHISSAFMGDSGGSIGKVASFSTTSCTLEDEIPATWLNKDEHIVASANDGTDAGHALRDSGDHVVLAGVDRQGRVLTGATNWSGISGFAAGDFLFLRSMFKGRQDGLRGWYPKTVGSSAFQGVPDRTVDSQRLAGFRVDGSAKGIESGLRHLGALTTAFQGRPNAAVCHPDKYAELLDSLGSDVIQEVKMGRVGFSGIKFITGAGEATIFSNPSCDLSRLYLLQTSDWILAHVGSQLVKFRQNERGGILHFQGGNGSNLDEYWAFMVAEYQFSCRAPGRGGVLHTI